MAAVRIVIESFAPYNGTTGFPIFLDCWKATIWIQVRNPNEVFFDDLDCAGMFATAGLECQSAPVVMGGMIRKGEPVNMNRTINVLPTAGGNLPDAITGYVIKEYFDPSLPDPVE